MSSTPWGVDLSPTYNATVDAQAVKDAGASYVILKVTEGVGWPDPSHVDEFAWFAHVGAAALAAGLELRTYHLATPSGANDAIGEAAWFDKHRGDHSPGPSIAYDLETIPGAIGPGLSARCFDTWAAQVGGWFPEALIEFYCNRYVLNEIGPWLRKSTPVWLAFPGWLPGVKLPGQNPVVRIQIGQRTIPGVAGNIDVNVSPGATLADVTEALGAVPPPAPAPVPATDWTLAVRTVDLRKAAITPVRGTSVKSLQVLLNLDGYALTVDGVAGPRTRDALGSFQAHHGMTLALDYVAGPKTWGALCSQ